MTDQFDRTNTGALFEPKFQRLLRYGRINIEGSEDSYSIIQVRTKSGKTVYEVHKRVGVMFPNEKRREGKRDPDTYGKIAAPNTTVEFNVSGWKKMSKGDEEFTSVSVRLAQFEVAPEPGEDRKDAFDDEVPF
jgi:hypothetical protein